MFLEILWGKVSFLVAFHSKYIHFFKLTVQPKIMFVCGCCFLILSCFSCFLNRTHIENLLATFLHKMKTNGKLGSGKKKSIIYNKIIKHKSPWRYSIYKLCSRKKVYNKGKHMFYLFLNDLFLERFEKFLAILHKKERACVKVWFTVDCSMFLNVFIETLGY